MTRMNKLQIAIFGIETLARIIKFIYRKVNKKR